MEKSQYNLCMEILRRFNRTGLLSDFILIGSWAMVFYKEQFKGWPRLNKFVLMTRDMDFLIVEFLTPERGKGIDEPLPLPTLGINATALRFLSFLSESTIKVPVEDFKITLPHPARFALHKLKLLNPVIHDGVVNGPIQGDFKGMFPLEKVHKGNRSNSRKSPALKGGVGLLIVAQRWRNKDKAEKDNMMASEILHDLIEVGEKESIRLVYRDLNVQWQKRVATGLKSLGQKEILEYLKEE